MAKKYSFNYGDLNRLRGQLKEIVEESRKETLKELYLKLLNAKPEDKPDLVQKMIDINAKFDSAKKDLTEILYLTDYDKQMEESFKGFGSATKDLLKHF